MNLREDPAARRVVLEGPFRALLRRPDFVRVAAEGRGLEFWMRGAGVEDAPLAQARTIELQWVAARVEAVFDTGSGRQMLECDSAAVHQPLPALYQRLPLARYDAAAQRFWRKVFLVIRLPGGRRLLRLLARRARRS